MYVKLKGNVSHSHTDMKPFVDTIVRNTRTEDIILRQSKQYLPLIQFEASSLTVDGDHALTNDLIEVYHQKMQELVDICLNRKRINTEEKTTNGSLNIAVVPTGRGHIVRV